MLDQYPPLLITLGDPNGLGPELACRFFSAKNTRESAKRPVLLLGPRTALEFHLTRRNEPVFWRELDAPARLAEQPAGIYLHCPPELDDFTPSIGAPTPEGGRAAGVALDLACSLLESGSAAGVVTLPLHKAMLQAAGFDFPGHTEFLANRAGLGEDDVCMHLCGDILRVSLVTTHPPLRDVPDLLSQERIVRCIALTHDFTRALGVIDKPIAVCGLNPHAGEMGKIGREEIEIIEPAIAAAQSQGYDAQGPFPGDTIFHRAAQGEFAAVLAMYHDQGLAPLKLMHFTSAVNVTLGLPFIRTSVDHGTGYDITGKDQASTGSLEMAFELARTLADATRNTI